MKAFLRNKLELPSRQAKNRRQFSICIWKQHVSWAITDIEACVRWIIKESFFCEKNIELESNKWNIKTLTNKLLNNLRLMSPRVHEKQTEKTIINWKAPMCIITLKSTRNFVSFRQLELQSFWIKGNILRLNLCFLD